MCDSAYCGPIQFATDGAVANGTTGGVAASRLATRATIFGWVNGLNSLGFQGSEVIFNPPNGKDGLPNSFNIYWGSIDALMTNPDGTPRYDNTLTVFTASPVNTQDSVTSSQLAAAGVFGVNGSAVRLAPTTNNGSIYATPLGDPLLHSQLDAKRV